MGDRYNEQIIRELKTVRDDSALTGFAKLKKIFCLSLSSSDRDIVFTVAPNMLENPKLLAMQMREIFSDIVPHYVQPVIEQGVADGSLFGNNVLRYTLPLYLLNKTHSAARSPALLGVKKASG